eukprot:TRINITY_DN18660_c0_g1_i1.p1 TRINITY_DN18660_c0_g1~~TRINITY_DN18660_c0_g1_i1.p1  ORF type:complete len:181 (-),score=17.89 TRINITY_DN18660_c0_g1_i1:78-620(-)
MSHVRNWTPQTYSPSINNQRYAYSPKPTIARPGHSSAVPDKTMMRVDRSVSPFDYRRSREGMAGKIIHKSYNAVPTSFIAQGGAASQHEEMPGYMLSSNQLAMQRYSHSRIPSSPVRYVRYQPKEIKDRIELTPSPRSRYKPDIARSRTPNMQGYWPSSPENSSQKDPNNEKFNVICDWM